MKANCRCSCVAVGQKGWAPMPQVRAKTSGKTSMAMSQRTPSHCPAMCSSSPIIACWSVELVEHEECLSGIRPLCGSCRCVASEFVSIKRRERGSDPACPSSSASFAYSAKRNGFIPFLLQMRNGSVCHIKATARKACVLDGKNCCARLNLVRGHGPLLPTNSIPLGSGPCPRCEY